MLPPHGAIWRLKSFCLRISEGDGPCCGALHIIAGVMAVSAILPVVVSRPKVREIDSMKRKGNAQVVVQK